MHARTVVVLTGLPGTGKSTLADLLARRTGSPAFAGDRLLGGHDLEVHNSNRNRTGRGGRPRRQHDEWPLARTFREQRRAQPEPDPDGTRGPRGSARRQHDEWPLARAFREHDSNRNRNRKRTEPDGTWGPRGSPRGQHDEWP